MKPLAAACALACAIPLAARAADAPFAIAVHGGAGPVTRAKLSPARERERRAADEALAKVVALGGPGGVIVLDRGGDAVFSFTTEGMYRGHAKGGGRAEVRIFREEP